MTAHDTARAWCAAVLAGTLIAVIGGEAVALPPSPSKTLSLDSMVYGIGVAQDGTVYLAQPNAGQVTEWLVDGTGWHLQRTLTGVQSPTDVAVDPRNGEVYVLAGQGVVAVRVFASGATTPMVGRDLAGPVTNSSSITISDTGTVYVSDYSAEVVLVYPPDSRTARATVNTGRCPTDVGLDPTRPWFYVAARCDGVVQVFDTSTLAPVPGATMTGIDQPHGVAVQPATGIRYVPAFGDGAGGGPNTAVGFSRTSTTADAPPLTGLNGPVAVAVNPQTNEVLVADLGYRVYVYPPPSASFGSVAPAAGPVAGGGTVTIAGANLGAVSRVRFGDVLARLVGKPLPDAIQVLVPPGHVAGPVAVEVSGGGLAAARESGYTYQPMAPAAAVSVTATPGNGVVDVTWAAPSFTGGLPLQGYVVSAAAGGAPCATTGLTCRIAGLTNGQKYRFTVTTTNTAGLSSVSEPVEATPYIPIKQTVKAKSGRSKLPRKGYATAVNWVKKPKYASLAFTTSCSVPQGFAGAELASSQLCKFTTYKTGKVKVRTKGYKNVQVKVSIQSVPNSKAAVQYGPSATWTRTWLVR